MADARRNLGRGLSALLGDGAGGAEDGVKEVPVTKLHPGKYQPRRTMVENDLKDLAQSIKELGVLQPILVRDHPDRSGEFEIIAGERRWRAAQLAQRHEVPVLIKTLSNRETLEAALVENLQREDLSPVEEANGLKRLMDEFDHTQEALARAVGKSRSHIANTLRLLSLPEPVQRLIDDGSLSAGHGRALVVLDDPETAANQVIREGLNVRQTEQLAQAKPVPKGSAKTPAAAKDPDIRALETDLTGMLGLRVSIKPKGPAGSVTIKYKSLDQLDGLLDRLSAARASGN